VSPSSQDLNRALRLVIDQRLILQEAEKLPTIAPTQEEVKNARDRLSKAFASAAEFQQRLMLVGLTSEKLDEILEQRVRIEKYLDFRFRNFVLISQKEITDYYNDVYAPRVRGRGQIVPTLEEALSSDPQTALAISSELRRKLEMCLSSMLRAGSKNLTCSLHSGAAHTGSSLYTVQGILRKACNSVSEETGRMTTSGILASSRRWKAKSPSRTIAYLMRRRNYKK
jgi:hypothetical protein